MRLSVVAALILSLAKAGGTDALAEEQTKAVVPAPTFVDMKYGPHERNTLDFWKAAGNKPTPLVMIIHGGGWLGNDKTRFVNSRHRHSLPWLLEHGVSVAAINYRYARQAPLPAPVHDAARALQFLRYKAAELGIDKQRVAVTGASAGGCTSLWLATHDDLADPSAADPVARESTRVSAAWANSAQTTIDPKVIAEWFGDIPVTHPMIHFAAGFANRDELAAGYAKKADLYHEFSPVAHLSKDDPLMLLTYHGRLSDRTNAIHHPIFGARFRDHARRVGARCVLDLPQDPEASDKAPHWQDFLKESLGK